MDRRVQNQHADNNTGGPTLRAPSPIQRINADRTEEEEKNECSHSLDGTLPSITVNH